MAVDLGRFDAGAVRVVDLPDPGHPGDGIQTEVDELGVFVDIIDAHLQFRREQRFQEIGDVLRRCLRSGWYVVRGSFRRRLGHAGRGRCGGLCRRCGPGIGQEMLHHALQRVTLADEAPVVHRQFAHIGRFDRIEQRRAEIPLECAHVAGIACGDRIGERQRAREDGAARAAVVRQAFGAQFAAGVFGSGEQGFPGQIQAQPRRENQRGTGARREAVLHVRTDIAAFGAEQAEVREHAQRPAAADSMPLHCGDDRQLAAHRQLVDLRIGEFGGALLDRQQTLAGAAAGEVRVVAGEHHGAVGVGSFDMREDRFQPVDQFGRIQILRIAIDHAHHDHAVVPHLDVDGGGLRQRQCGAAFGAGHCRCLAVGISIAVAPSRRVVEAAPLAQQRGRTQRRGLGKRQRGRQHVGGGAARDEAR